MKKLCTTLAALICMSAFTQNEKEPESLFESIGTLSGSAGLYHNQVWNVQEGPGYRDGYYSNAFLNLKFVTNDFAGLKLGVGGWFSNKLGEKNDDYSNGTIDTVSNMGINDRDVLSELYLQYNVSKTTITIGRQEIWRQILADNFEGVTIVSNEIENLEIFATWVLRENWVWHDIVWDDFITYWGNSVNDDGSWDASDDHSGVYGTEITYTVNENLALTGLYYTAETVDTWGGRATLSGKLGDYPTSLVIDYHKTDAHNNDWNNGDDGEVFALNPSITFDKLTVGCGYIQVADVTTGGNGAGVWFNDPYDPFDFGYQTRYDDAQTYYLQAIYAPTDCLSITALYGETDYGASSTANVKEVNLGVTYTWENGLEANLTYVSVDEDDQNAAFGDFNQLYTYVKYCF